MKIGSYSFKSKNKRRNVSLMVDTTTQELVSVKTTRDKKGKKILTRVS